MPLPEYVTDWITVPDVAEHMDVSVTDVRQLIREGRLIALREAPGEPLRIPATFVQHGEVTKHLVAVLTLLRDGGYDELESLAWLFRPDESLPGTPIEALRADRGTEIKRRAQAAAF